MPVTLVTNIDSTIWTKKPYTIHTVYIPEVWSTLFLKSNH